MTTRHDLKLYVSPGSCARVPTAALEEIGVPFQTELLRFAAKQHKSPEYLALNPKGKVPALVVDGRPLTENVAIATWLHRTYPEAGLLPTVGDELDAARQIADLSFFSATMHPFVTRIAWPKRFMAGEGGFDLVRPVAIQGIDPYLSMIDRRLAEGPWWYGDRWSIVDVYLFWVWWRIAQVDFPGAAFTNIAGHAERIQKRPCVARAMAREAVHVEQLKAEGLYTNLRKDLEEAETA